jgi:SAM-dependent methyltransferase
MSEKRAYCQAANTGKYERPAGLLGKYDNVRRFWEDRITADFLAPALGGLSARKTTRDERVRILDLGCGSGDGFDLLTGVSLSESVIGDVHTSALSMEIIDGYIGVDLNEDLILQAEACYGKNPKAGFLQGDLSHGLPPQVEGLDAFDVYFAGYGTLSHFHDEQSVKIIADICRHASDGAVFVGDWLGRYSYEWQDLWHHPVDREYFMDYRISYIYPEDEREHVEVLSFPLRLMNRNEIMALVNEAQRASGVEIKPVRFFDRSIYIGRHMETGDYNKNCPKIRSAVNSLFEQYKRTDLDGLLVDYVPRDGFGDLNTFFKSFFDSCNDLVEYTKRLLAAFDPGKQRIPLLPEIPVSSPEPVKEAMETMQRVVEGLGGIAWCEPRANMIEPMLGYCLRKLEMDLQPGSGMGHGLIGVFEIRK